jgi:Holliday junction resolvase RusA-like endonuclease
MTGFRVFTFTIPGRAVGKESVRVTGAKIAKDGHPYVQRYFPDKTKNFVALVKMAAKQAGIPMMERVKMDIEIGIPARIKGATARTPEQILEPMVRPDRDNVGKSINDALTGIAFKDDKHVIDGNTRYVFTKADQAFTRVTLREVDWTEYIEV